MNIAFPIILTAIILLGWRIKHIQSPDLTEKGKTILTVLQLAASVYIGSALPIFSFNRGNQPEDILLAARIFTWIAFVCILACYICYFFMWLADDSKDNQYDPDLMEIDDV